MSTQRLLAIAILASLCAGLGTGCRTRGTGSDMLSPVDVLPGDHPLASWESLGTLDTSVQFADVLFAFDSFQIRSSERTKLETVARYLKSTPRVRLVLEGHCDERGSREYNMTLGEHRALAARAYLIGLRVDANRILTRSYGEEKPKALAHNEQSWSLNRRVEFAIYR